MQDFDYVIVGAGSAGSALANRLSESGKFSVLLIEAGGTDRRFWLQVPIGYGKVFYDGRVNWKYATEPEPNCDNQPMYWPRGKALGGSSSINAMVYVRGHPHDFDEWGEVAPGWSWTNVAPVFKRMEQWEHGEDAHRGGDGPLSVHDVSKDVHALTRTYLKAAAQAGIPNNPDYNGAEMEGSGVYQINTKNGLRASASRAYLWPAKSRKNLTIRTGILAEKIVIENRRAVGVRFQQNGQSQVVNTRREVILCAGAINSPQLLQLSGIGPAGALKSAGVEPLLDAPQVGQNLMDHLGHDNVYLANVPTMNQVLRPLFGKLKVGLQYILSRTGPLSMSLNQGGGFVRLREGAKQPDLQLYFSPLSYSRAPAGERPLMSPDKFPGFRLGFSPCKPTSKGHLVIRSADPSQAPVMHGNYLSTEYDRQTMIDGIRFVRKIARAPALQDVTKEEMQPGPDLTTDEQLLDFVRKTAGTVFHQCGTCTMGRDAANSVVDARLRVHGIDGLRVADASVFPTIPSGNTNAPSIMVGERASDLILQDASH